MAEANKETEAAKKIRLREEVRQKTAGYILTALGLVVGLAWNDAISAFIQYVFPLDKNGIPAKFIYAVILTILIVIISRYVLKPPVSKEE